MKSSAFLLFFALLSAPFSASAASAPANIYARNPTSLNGKWNYIIDPYDVGYENHNGVPFDAVKSPKGGYFLDRHRQDKTDLLEYDFDLSPTLNVPGDWNSQDQRLMYYEGSVWYRRLFDAPKQKAGSRLFLYFAAANYEADVYLNGKKLGRHVGGFTPFAYEVTGIARPKNNSVVVRVNNQRHAEGVPTTSTDWWNYGGLTRDVLLVETPATFIRDFRVRLKPGTRDQIEARVELDGPQKTQNISVRFPSLNLSGEAKTDAAGVAHLEMGAPKLPLWSPETPNLEETVITCETDETRDRIGFRTIETKGTDILLNGRPVFFRGVSVHEEIPQRGARAYSEQDAKQLLGWAKELNCNFVRLAHYPHNEHMARVADELGLMVWEEIPVYWAIQWTNRETLALAQAQLRDEIDRDQNRASVVVWSVANETPVSDERMAFLKQLVATARSADGTRLVSAAMEVHADPANPNGRVVDDPFGEFTDLLSFNEYIGWYDGLPDKLARITWSFKWPKPVFVSEFGADAVQGWHADPLTRYSEEYQRDVYEKTLAMLQKIPAFRGCSPWVLCDFRSPRRLLPKVQDGWNRKGLIGENGIKKEAFETLKIFYDEKQKAEEKNK